MFCLTAQLQQGIDIHSIEDNQAFERKWNEQSQPWVERESGLVMYQADRPGRLHPVSATREWGFASN